MNLQAFKNGWSENRIRMGKICEKKLNWGHSLKDCVGEGNFVAFEGPYFVNVANISWFKELMLGNLWQLVSNSAFLAWKHLSFVICLQYFVIKGWVPFQISTHNNGTGKGLKHKHLVFRLKSKLMHLLFRLRCSFHLKIYRSKLDFLVSSG